MYKGEEVNRCDFAISTVIALLIHAGIFFSGGFFYTHPEILLKRGKSCIRMTLIASKPSVEVKQAPRQEIVKLPEKKRLELPVEKKEDVPAVNSEETVADLKEKGVIAETRAEIANLYKPEYPEYCRKRGQDGRVILQFRILANGEANSIRIVKSSGYLRLDNAARKSLSKARFIAAERMGIPINVTEKIVFKFCLKHGQVKIGGIHNDKKTTISGK